ncbi:hypothetical protein FGB62_209g04 [Gracilaria domingensis]|nr:hypothetical protein FGB62_209g04 [Gracilaria domingensis]
MFPFRESEPTKLDVLSVCGSSQITIASKISRLVQQRAKLLSDPPDASVQSITSATVQSSSAAKVAPPSLQQLSRGFQDADEVDSAPRPAAAQVAAGAPSSSAPPTSRIYAPKFDSERPINSLSYALGLASIYGPD